MDFFIRDDSGKDIGPLAASEIERRIADGRINAATPVRNSMMNRWKRIDQLGSFADALSQAAEHSPDSGKQRREPREEEQGTAFRNRVNPVNGGIFLRLASAFTDFMLLAVVALIIAGAILAEIYVLALNNTPAGEAETAIGQDAAVADGNKTAPAGTGTESGIDNLQATRMPTRSDNRSGNYNFGSLWRMDNGRVYCCVYAGQERGLWIEAGLVRAPVMRGYLLFSLAVILYFSLALGLYAQTVGMWFWGLFITREDNDEVYMFRAFVYAILLILLGWLMPLIVFLRGRAPHDRLAGVKVVRISGAREF